MFLATLCFKEAMIIQQGDVDKTRLVRPNLCDGVLRCGCELCDMSTKAIKILYQETWCRTFLEHVKDH